MEDNRNKAVGGLVISEEVIAQIAGVAAKDVKGVKGLVARPSDIRGILKKQRSASAVQVAVNDSTIAIDIFLCLKLGARIPEVSEAVQSSVKEAVQNMTGKVVTKVNVHIQDIDLTDDAGQQ